MHFPLHLAGSAAEALGAGCGGAGGHVALTCGMPSDGGLAVSYLGIRVAGGVGEAPPDPPRL